MRSALNRINQKEILRNIQSLCPLIFTYICNCYAAPARLFPLRGGKILSKEETTQADPTSMVRAYALGILPMLHSLLYYVLTNEFKLKN